MGNGRASRSLWGSGSLHVSGHTFAELLAVLGVLAVLILVAMPRLEMPDTLSASALARQIAVDLRLAQQLSIGERDMYTLEFNPAAVPYTSYTLRNESTLAVEPDFPKDIPSQITVSGRRSFAFAAGGCVDDDANSANGCAGTDGSVTVSSGAVSATINVYWYTGRVKVVGP
ncbi:MAG: pilus assembly FimT family protein [Armatimonadota bacterium]